MQITIIHNDIELEVEYNYQPHEAQTMEYPGCPEDAEIEAIYYNDTNVYKIYEANYLLDDISKLILKEIHDDDQYDLI